MKNLPDKIYLCFGEMSEDRFEKEDYKELCEHSELVTFREFKFWDADVEYTRTDAFIKKLEEWLDEYISDLASVDTHILVGSFKNYVEGKLDYGW